MPATEAAAPAAPVESPVPAAAAPTGPLTVERLRECWPDVLARLERISRSAWLVASAATVADLRDGDVLTLAFRSASDLNRFKQRSADGGPSEALRAAIRGVTGVTVKYLARMDDDSAPEGPGGGDGGSGPRTPPPPADGGSAAPRNTAARTTEAPRSAERRTGTAERQASASAAVTEWAVAPIPSSAPTSASTGAGRPLAVDDDPDDAPARTATATIAREGDVLPAADVVPSMDEPPAYDDEDAPPPPPDDDIPTIVAPRLAPTVSARADGVQRYGEAVVRQVLGATFVREETYESGTRFS
jgi:DNA polymerase-3 subunit gamma/tau